MFNDFLFLVLPIDSESFSKKIKIRETTLLRLPEYSSGQDLKMAPSVINYGILILNYL